jgi:branched-chain amino acid aminotransferase
MKEIEGKYFLANGIEKRVEEFKDDTITKGRTIYEVIRVMDRKPLFFNPHIERLHNSAILAGLEFNINDSELKAQIIKLIEINHIESGNVKIALIIGSLYIFKIKHSYPDKSAYDKGVSAVLFMAERKDPNIKIIDTGFRARANEKIKEKNAYEAILVDNNGYITEGSRSNIFMVKGNTLVTSPASQVLPGVTRNIIIALAEKIGIAVMEDKVSFRQIGEMDGIFISGTSPKVLPVNKVDDIDFRSSSNPVIKQIMKEYDKFAAEDISSFT